MTPQPQPEAYWIALLDELTDGWFSEATEGMKINDYKYLNLSEFIYLMFIGNNHALGHYFWDEIWADAHHITSGQSIIDAALRYDKVADTTAYFAGYLAIDNLRIQADLYKRCNGIVE